MSIAKRTKLTKEEREEVGGLLIHTLIVEAHCKKLYGGEHWPPEQFLFVWEKVRDWDEDRYGTAAVAVVDDLQQQRFNDRQRLARGVESIFGHRVGVSNE